MGFVWVDILGKKIYEYILNITKILILFVVLCLIGKHKNYDIYGFYYFSAIVITKMLSNKSCGQITIFQNFKIF